MTLLYWGVWCHFLYGPMFLPGIVWLQGEGLSASRGYGNCPWWTDKHPWKHYLPATSLAGGNNFTWYYFITLHEPFCQCLILCRLHDNMLCNLPNVLSVTIDTYDIPNNVRWRCSKMLRWLQIDDLNMTKRFQIEHVVDICSLRLRVQANNISDTGQTPFIRTPRNQY